MENIKEQLMAEARIKGICADGYAFMRSLDRDMLVAYYIANPDWCMERNFPDLHTLTEEFSDCENKGVFINRKFNGEVLNDLQTYVFHNCIGTISVGLNIRKAILPMMYFGNGCDMRIEGLNQDAPNTKRFKPKPSIIPLYIFGENKIKSVSTKSVNFHKYLENML